MTYKKEEKRFKRVYVEITNVCNLACDFCPKTDREAKFLSEEEFSIIINKIKDYTDYVYFHIMGEPLLHPLLKTFITIAKKNGLKVCITTNGTLIKDRAEILLSSDNIFKFSVSLHSFEGNNNNNIDNYLKYICEFSKKAPYSVSLRLWNEGGANSQNKYILNYLSENFGIDITEQFNKYGKAKIANNVYLEGAKKFQWPNASANKFNVIYCQGLNSQIGILSNGVVVPCCLDNQGEINLGNIFKQDLSEILSGVRAKKILKGYETHKPSEELCKRCEYATRFTK